MKEAKYSELEYWGWECPDCQNWNETQDDPSYDESIFCDKCGHEFEPIQE